MAAPSIDDLRRQLDEAVPLPSAAPPPATASAPAQSAAQATEAPSIDDLRKQMEEIAPVAASVTQPAQPSSLEDRMRPGPSMPANAPGPPLPPAPTTAASSGDYFKRGAVNALSEVDAGLRAGVLSPEYQRKLEAVPYVGGVLGEGSKLIGGALAVPGAAFHALQGGVASAADAVIPPNAGGSIGPSLAAGLELAPFYHIGAGPLDVRSGGPAAVQRVRDIVADQSVPLGPEFRGAPFAPGTSERVAAGPVPGATEPTGIAPSTKLGTPAPPQRLSVGADPEPGSIGAAATPSAALPEASRAEALRNLERSVNQSAVDRAGPQGVDNTPYVKGIPTRPLASRVFTSQNALDEKMLRAKPELGGRDTLDKIETDRNHGMVDLLRKDAGDSVTLDAAKEARKKAAPEQFGAFDGEVAVPDKAADLLKSVDAALASPSAKRGAIRNALEDVRGELFDKQGNLETLPSRLYGARQNLTDLIDRSKGTGDEAKKLQAATAILTEMLPTFDDTINSGAPKYNLYREEYRRLSQPVNQQEFLQQYTEGTSGKKITDSNGNLQPTRVQTLLNDILQEQKRTGISSAKSLTDEQIQNIINVRNELHAGSLRDLKGSVRGSDSFQQFNREAEQGSGVLGTAVRAATGLAAQGAMAHLMGLDPTLNALGLVARGVGKPVAEAARLRRKETERRTKTEARTSELLTQGPANALQP
jgi:hypothetical protein